MNTIQEIETAIHQLPPDDRWALLHRFQGELWSEWDREIENDSKAGRLDGLISEARADIAANRTRPLDEIIRDT